MTTKVTINLKALKSKLENYRAKVGTALNRPLHLVSQDEYLKIVAPLSLSEAEDLFDLAERSTAQAEAMRPYLDHRPECAMMKPRYIAVGGIVSVDKDARPECTCGLLTMLEFYGDDRGRGFYRKYRVERLHDPEGKHNDCRYFVLDLNHDEFAIPALKAYVESCADEYPVLAYDLLNLIREHEK